MSGELYDSSNGDVTIPLGRLRAPLGDIYYSTELIAKLADEAQAGYRTKPWGGVEVGGLLLGTRAGGPITVLERAPLDCEHEYGPAFELTSAEKQRLAGVLEQLQNPEREIVGWYRTTSKELAMTQADTDLADVFFARALALTLVIRRAKDAAPVFGWWQKSTAGEWRFAGENAAAARAVAESPLVVAPTAPDIEPVAAAPVANIESQPAADVPAATSALAVVEPEPASDPQPAAGTQTVVEPEPAPPEPRAGEAEPEPVVPLPPSTTNVVEPYLARFGFREDPFASTSDLRYWVETRTHKQAFDKLLYGILMRKGCLALSGIAGAGKSFVLERVAQSLEHAGVEFAVISNSRLSAEQFFEILGVDLDLRCQSYRKVQVLVALQDRVMEAASRGSTVAILVDNAHRLAPDVLEEIDLLGNYDSRRGKLLQVVLSGDLELDDKIRALDSLRQRLAVRVRVDPLDEPAAAAYIRSRVQNAGADSALFPDDVAREIFARTRGLPRLINALASAVLERAFEVDEQRLTPDMVTHAAAEAQLDAAVGA
jgi:general secretion pathway protein A